MAAMSCRWKDRSTWPGSCAVRLAAAFHQFLSGGSGRRSLHGMSGLAANEV